MLPTPLWSRVLVRITTAALIKETQKHSSSNQIEGYFSLAWQSEFQVGKAMWSGWWLLCHCLVCLPKSIWSLLLKPSGAENNSVVVDTCSSKAQLGNCIGHCLYSTERMKSLDHAAREAGIGVWPPEPVRSWFYSKWRKTVRGFYHREGLTDILQTRKLRHRTMRKLLQEQYDTGIHSWVVWL